MNERPHETDRDGEAVATKKLRSDRAMAVEATASVVAAQRVSDPDARKRVEKEVGRRLDQQAARGVEPPAVKIYDVKAPAQRDATAALPTINRSSERTR